MYITLSMSTIEYSTKCTVVVIYLFILIYSFFNLDMQLKKTHFHTYFFPTITANPCLLYSS